MSRYIWYHKPSRSFFSMILYLSVRCSKKNFTVTDENLQQFSAFRGLVFIVSCWSCRWMKKGCLFRDNFCYGLALWIDLLLLYLYGLWVCWWSIYWDLPGRFGILYPRPVPTKLKSLFLFFLWWAYFCLPGAETK